MAKNFSSVLESLRVAGKDKIQEVDSVYALNCDWLLEQFKQTQASLLALVPTSRAAIQDIPEQQSTAKTGSRQGQTQEQSVLPAGTAAHDSEPQETSQQQTEAAQPAVAATPMPGARMTRSRRNQTDAATCRPAQGSADETSSQRFPSPPKTRARGKRNQPVSKHVAVPATTRRGAKAALAQPGTAVESGATEQQELDSAPKPPSTDLASPVLQQSVASHVQRVQKPSSSPEAVLATVSDSSTDKQQYSALASPSEASIHASPAPVVSSLKTSAQYLSGTPHHSVSSISRPAKRKHSAAGESQLAIYSKCRHSGSGEPLHEGSPATDRASELTATSLRRENRADSAQVLQQQPAENNMNINSPEAKQHHQMLDEPSHQVPLVTTAAVEAGADMASPAEAAAIASTTKQDARTSDYQDAHERLSSPMPASPTASSEGQQPAESAVPLLVHATKEQHMSPASQAGCDCISQRESERLEHASPIAAASPHPSPVHDDDDDALAAADATERDVIPQADTSANVNVVDQGMDSKAVSNSAGLSALVAAAAMPLPDSITSQGADSAADIAESSSDAPSASGGMAGNLVSAIRSFLPGGKAPEPQLAGGKKPVKVKALEAADAARRKEAARNADRIKQKGTLDKQRAERAKAKQEEEQLKVQEEVKRRQEAMRKKEEEAAQRRRAKEEAERKERQERQAKAEALRAKKKAEELKKKEPERGGPRQAEPQPSRAPLQMQSSNVPPVVASSAGLAVNSKPLHYSLGLGPTKMPLAQASSSGYVPAPSMPSEATAAQVTSTSQYQSHAAAALPVTQPKQTARPADAEGETYQISPYRGDDSDAESSEGNDPRKPIPEWARGRALMQQLASQVQTDPDEVFQQHRKTCSLDEVFGHSDTDKHKQKKDLSRRTSSGNWIEDRVTWKEELNYKKAMGYV
ncbi:hypothetical protein WJX77_011218 [Trebouxia sp. C0004]